MDSSKLDNLKLFIENQSILVVDSSPSSRSTLSKSLFELGAKPDNVYPAKNYEDALTIIDAKKPKIVITEFELGNYMGLDLKTKVSEYCNPSESIFVIVTLNGDETAIAEAAEEEVDAYVLKPFVYTYLVESLRAAIRSKVSPSDYMQLIVKGRNLLNESRILEAREFFEQALESTDKKPALALSYLGLCCQKVDNYEEAIQFFNRGLEIHPMHYKSSMGKFESLKYLGRKEEAYELLSSLSVSYPLSPQRIMDLFLLAVYTSNYTDADRYFTLFQRLERKSEKVKKVVGAGMLACGKYLLKDGEKSQALEIFNKGLLAANLDFQYILKIVRHLFERGHNFEAEFYLSRTRPDDRESSEYKSIYFELQNTNLSDVQVIDRGRSLIKEGSAKTIVYDKVIGTYLRLGKKSAAENMTYEAMKHLPEAKEHFQKILDEIESKG
ncbi:MAG: tetratricopeptide repeat protein [Bdellovibrionales bacterium]